MNPNVNLTINILYHTFKIRLSLRTLSKKNDVERAEE